MASEDSGRPRRTRWTEEQLAEEVAIVSAHVEALTQRLLKHVEEHLQAEGSVPSKEWVQAAYHVVLSELPDGDDRAIADLDQAREKALTSLQKSLAGTGEIEKPSEEEVLQHTRELAQCVVSNWVTDINLSFRRARGADVFLGPDWLPVGSTDALDDGVRAFAADPNFVLQQWQEYLHEGMTSKASLAVSGELEVIRTGSRYQVVARSEISKPDSARQRAVAASGTGVRAREALDRVVEVVMTKPDNLHTQTLLGSDAFELEADVTAAAVAAAAINSGGSVPVRKPLVREVGDKSLYRDLGAFVRERCTQLTENIMNFEVSSEPMVAIDSDDLRQAWEDLKQRLQNETGPLWKRVYRIALGATVLASAAKCGIVELELDQERSRLHEYTQLRDGDSPVPDRKIMGFAEGIARYAVTGKAAQPLGSHLQTLVAQRLDS